MKGTKKILVAGVGGQGIVYLTNLIVEAAMLSDVPVSVSEIHGLSQRGGTVTAGIGLGERCRGFIGSASVDFLFGLEALEARRCLPFLHSRSGVAICDTRIPSNAVNSMQAVYPETSDLKAFLDSRCAQTVILDEVPDEMDPLLCNVMLLGAATRMKTFAFGKEVVEAAIRESVPARQLDRTLEAFNAGIEFAAGKKKPINSKS